MLKSKPLFFVEVIVSGVAANAEEAEAVEEKLFELAEDFLDDAVNVHGSHDFEKLEYPRLLEFTIEAVLDTPAQVEHLEDGLELIHGNFGWNWSQPEDPERDRLNAESAPKVFHEVLHMEVKRYHILELQKFVEEGFYYPSVQSSADFKECILEIQLHKEIKTGTDYNKLIAYLSKASKLSEETLRQAKFVQLKWEGRDVSRRN